MARAVDFDRTAVRVRPGVTAAFPVFAMMALGTLIDQPVAAVTMGVGAMLVGVAWRGAGAPSTPPLGTMAAAAGMLTLATFVGTITGRWPWLHLAVLFVFCLWAGLSSAVGRRGNVVGTQTLIAFIVFGRFPESAVGGLRLAGLVLAGAAVQLLFAALVASPLAWRRQRRALAVAYEQLAAVAMHLTSSGVAAAEALDAAEQALGAPALFGDPQLSGLVTLVSEGRRIRLELLVLSSLLSQLPRRATGPGDDAVGSGTSAQEVEGALRRLGDVLELIVATLRGADPGDLELAAEELRRWGDGRSPVAAPLLEQRVAALGGQVRAAGRQAVAVSRDGADRTWRLPHPQLGSRQSLGGVGVDLQRVRDAVSLSSPAGRHAVRLAVVVAGTELLTQRLGLPRGYWAVVAAATVLRPNFGDTFTRGAERVLGTLLGAVVATLIAVAVDPSGWGIDVTIGILAVFTYTTFAASFAAGVAGLTAMIVFLLYGVAPDSTTIALDRGLDTIIGGAIGLLATVLWPTWSSDALPRALQVFVGAQRDYLSAVFAELLSGAPAGNSAMRPLARHVRMAYGDADTSINVARSEPQRSREQLTVSQAADALAALRRVTYGIHALRLADSVPHEGHPELAPLGNGLLDALASIVTRVVPNGTEPRPLPPLRDLYRQTAVNLGDGVGLSLDELVDAVNSAGAALGD